MSQTRLRFSAVLTPISSLAGQVGGGGSWRRDSTPVVSQVRLLLSAAMSSLAEQGQGGIREERLYSCGVTDRFAPLISAVMSSLAGQGQGIREDQGGESLLLQCHRFASGAALY